VCGNPVPPLHDVTKKLSEDAFSMSRRRCSFVGHKTDIVHPIYRLGKIGLNAKSHYASWLEAGSELDRAEIWPII